MQKKKTNVVAGILQNKRVLLKRAGLLCLGTIFLIAVLAIFKFVQKKRHANDDVQPTSLADQYRKQLPALKEKANDNNANDLQNYGIALYATGNLADAEQTYRKQIEVDQNNAMVHNNLANTLRDEKKFDEAAQEYQKSITLSPKTLNAYYNLGSVYQYSLNNIDKAIEVYQQGLSQNPDSADLDVLTALAFEQKGDKENAKQYFQKALEVQNDNQSAKAGLARLEK